MSKASSKAAKLVGSLENIFVVAICRGLAVVNSLLDAWGRNFSTTKSC